MPALARVLCAVLLLLGLLGLLGVSGCGGLKVGQASTVIAVGTQASGVGDIHAKGCLWVIGAGGLYRGMAAIIAQGDATLDECAKVQPATVFPAPPDRSPGQAPAPEAAPPAKEP